MDRRQWLLTWARLAGGALLGAACGDNLPAQLPFVGLDRDTSALAPDYLFATFEPRHDSALAWLAAPGPASGVVELVADGEETANVVAAVEVSEAAGWTGAVRVDGLAPATEYRYRFVIDGVGPGPWLRLRTAPSLDDMGPVRLLVSADIGPRSEYYGIFTGLSRHDADLYLNLGDWPYADKVPAARTLDEFRARHREVRSPPEIQDFLWHHPVAAIYDDHDLTDNWNRALATTDPALLTRGIAAWREWIPLESSVQYRDFRWGRLAHLFVLDTRLYRDDPTATSPEGRRMLGDDQLAWLQDGLATSNAAFKIIVTSVPFEFNGTDDDWGAYEEEKEILRGTVRDEGVTGVVFLSGDRHWFAARHLEHEMREYQVGPIAAGLGRYPDAFPSNVFASALSRNYGLLAVEADGASAIMTFQCYDEDHDLIYAETTSAPIP